MASYPLVRQEAAVDPALWQAVGVCERIAAILLILLLAPVMIASAAAIWLLSGQSPLIAHRRVGWRGEPLWMLKLRTMWTGGSRNRRPGDLLEHVEDEAGPERKQTHDPRVAHWFARFCRRHSIDEMPQLWHVIRGEMSLVGPRPITAAELRQYYSSDAEEVLRVKPGIAGLWQISGRNHLSYAERRRLDVRYVRNRSLKLYFKILMRTLPEVWRGANSW
jgi:exopolysaccharide production protein ExoY